VSSLRLLFLLTLAIVSLLTLGADPASAATLHSFEGVLTEADGTTAYPFADPAGVAVDGSGGIWVTDPGTGAVDRFGPTGSFAGKTEGAPFTLGGAYLESAAWDGAAGPAGELLVSDSGEDDLWGLGPGGAYSGNDLNLGIGGCCYIRVAADGSGTATDGDIYVFTRQQAPSVRRFTAAGAPAEYTAGSAAGTNVLTGADTASGSFGGPNQSATKGAIAVDAAGRLYVADGEHHVVDVFEPSGEIDEALTITEAGGRPLGEVNAVAIDPTNGDILVADPTSKVVDIFGPSGTFLSAISEAAGPFGQIRGLAVGPTGDVYVADGETHAVDVFGPGAVVPDVTAATVSNLTDNSATLNGTVDPDGVALTACRFEYVTEAAFQATGFTDLSSGGEVGCTPAVAAIPVDSSPHAVHADVSGLRQGVVYRYRLVAANANGTNRSSPAATPQMILGESTLGVTATSAELQALIDPSGVPTAYHFEYLTESDYLANGSSFLGLNAPTLTPVPDASAGSGIAAVPVSRVVLGLDPSTAYVFRVVAASSIGTVHGAARAFTTEPALSGPPLPDGRAWELVSPPQKFGAVIASRPPLGQFSAIQAAADGSGLAYAANAPIESAPDGYAGEPQILSTRGPDGWTSRNISIPHQSTPGGPTGASFETKIFSPDFETSVLQPFGLFNPSISAEASEQTAYLQTLGSCTVACYRPLVTGAPGFANVPPGTGFGEEANCEQPISNRATLSVCGPRLVGATPSLDHIALMATGALVPGAPVGHLSAGSIIRGSLYEWTGGNLALVSVLPPDESGEELPAEPGTSALGSTPVAEAVVPLSAKGAISIDGSRVFWTYQGGPGLGGLMMRDIPAAKTIRLDAAEPACVAAAECQSGGGVFQSATPDGSTVYFTDANRLTADSGATVGKADLYRCEIRETAAGPECELTDLTPAGPGGAAADVQGAIFGTSSDGSSVYFVANGILAPGAADGRCTVGSTPPAGATCNLYLSHGGTTRLLAVLSAEDANDWTATADSPPVRVSPDGDYVAFMAQRPLTGYDNRDAVTGLPDAEVYIYSAAEGAVRCASCNPTGARPHGVDFYQLLLAAGGRDVWPRAVAAVLPGNERFESNAPSFYQPRYLSNSGRLFFNSVDSLVPSDSNGTADVYQYEPAEVGSCTTTAPTFGAASHGCVSLISSGTSGEESGFLDASESGDDVFFLTRARLVPADVDSSLDVYDARVGGGEAETVKPVECSGDACQQPAVPPNDSTPGSLTFSGAGNVVECSKGKVKKSGKCVAKKSSKKKHHKKKGHKKQKRASSKHGGHK